MPEQEYPLARGFRSAARLNLQHYLWKQSLGFLVHPRALPKIDNPRIADLGTGTGIWLLDLSESLPTSAQLDGFDVDLSQAPPTEWLPQNVSLRKLDILQELPEDLVGQFDLIHVRFFICVVQNADPEPILSKINLMLKPGGFVQWTEMDRDTMHITALPPKERLKASEDFLAMGMAPSPKWPASSQAWVKSLGRFMEDAGFSNVHEHRNQTKPWQRAPNHDVSLMAMEEMSQKVTNLDVPGGPSSTQEIVERAAREFEDHGRGISILGDGVTVIGQKQ